MTASEALLPGPSELRSELRPSPFLLELNELKFFLIWNKIYILYFCSDIFWTLAVLKLFLKFVMGGLRCGMHQMELAGFVGI